MAAFLPLTVTAITRETRDAVAVTLAPRPQDAAAFAFAAGQYLTFRRDFDGVELRRSYSICAAPGEALRVGVKRVEGGVFSGWINDALAVGDRVQAMPPQGRFGLPPQPDARRHVLMVAAGSGITPILSLIRATLAGEPGSRVTLLYGNRGAASMMFREAIEDLKNTYLGRFSVIHVLSRDAGEIDLFQGRIDAAKVDALACGWLDLPSVALAYLCGPTGLMDEVTAALGRHNLPPEAIRREAFVGAQPGRAPQRAMPRSQTGAACAARITLDGATVPVAVAPGQTVLEAALAADLEAPWSCRAGVCSTCRARVTQGAARMRANSALEDDEVRDGYILTCQAEPTTADLALTYDV